MSEEDNIYLICEDCVKKAFPNKGKFTLEEISMASQVKKRFGREHLWVEVDSLSEWGIVGYLATCILDCHPDETSQFISAFMAQWESPTLKFIL